MELKTGRFSVKKLRFAADVFKTIAYPVRLEILEILEDGKAHSVSEMLEQTGVEASLFSHHLAKMRDKGLIESHREGRRIYYTLAMKEITNILDCVAYCNV